MRTSVRYATLAAALLIGLAGCGRDITSPGAGLDRVSDAAHLLIGTPWVASGPGTVTLLSDGTGSSNAAMSYSRSGSVVFSTNTWQLSTTATTSGPVTLPFTYSGYHAFFQVRVFVRAFVNGIEFPLIAQGPVNCCSPPSGGFNLSGSITLNVSAGDVYGFRFGGSNFDSDSRLIGTFTVKDPPDLTPPTIALSANPTTLWPPNHKMHLVASGISASDNRDPNPSLNVTVSSNEPLDGSGDGDTESDWLVQANGDGTFDVWVRAERSGGGSGRTYTITATATDAAGNSATQTATVTVAPNRGK